MFAKLAAYPSGKIGCKPRGFDDLDETLHFQTLVFCLANYVNYAKSVPRRPLYVIDHERFNLPFRRFESQAELFLQHSEYRTY
jgi:hypothetical protein